MDATAATSDGLVPALRRRIDQTLGPLVDGERGVVLIGYPNHENCGDSAIWVGERAWLRNQGVRAAYVADASGFCDDVMARRGRARTILLHGGGNLGDVWRDHQDFRERIIATYPRHRIVQLPQTIHFRSPASVKRAQSVFDAHDDLTILVRDERSLAFAREHFRAKSELCPDMAFAITGLERSLPRHDVLWLARADAEARRPKDAPASATAPRTDWPLPGASGRVYPRLRTASNVMGRVLHERPWLHRAVHPLISRTYDALARERLLAACRTLSGGATVITDRLHGHILCLLLGIPHVVLDNNYGKLSSFYATWTHRSARARWADSEAEALELASW